MRSCMGWPMHQTKMLRTSAPLELDTADLRTERTTPE